MENLSNFKAQMEHENIETKLNSTRLSGKHESASLRIYVLPMQMRLSGLEICSQRQVSFAFHHHCKLLNTIPKIQRLSANKGSNYERGN